MTFVVPYDGSELAQTALVRAVEFGSVLEEAVLAVCVIPKNNSEYAREHAWIGPDEEFDLEVVSGSVHEEVTDICPSANFRYEVVGRYAGPGTIAKRIRSVAKHVDASMVFIGSENAGRVVSSISSVGRTIATDEAYDVVIVRHRSPAKIKKLKARSPYRTEKSDFYLPD
jgi:nucleotide-binding universal stress UspA family protein